MRRYPKYCAITKQLEYNLKRMKELFPSSIRAHNIQQSLIPKIISEAVRKKEDYILSLVVDEQLYKRGITGDNVKISSYRPYTTLTKKRKLKKHQPINRVTLRDTIDFHNSFYIMKKKDGFYIVSSDEKAPYLIGSYGSAIMKLTPENKKHTIKTYLRPYIKERLLEEIKKAIKVK